LSLKDQYAKWPDAEERAIHSAAMAKKGFGRCFGFVDGTTPPFPERPEYKRDFYFDRKCDFSLNMQVLNDQHRRILYGFIGYSGIG
jgi:hypothetical protein